MTHLCPRWPSLAISALYLSHPNIQWPRNSRRSLQSERLTIVIARASERASPYQARNRAPCQNTLTQAAGGRAGGQAAGSYGRLIVRAGQLASSCGSNCARRAERWAKFKLFAFALTIARSLARARGHSERGLELLIDYPFGIPKASQRLCAA